MLEADIPSVPFLPPVSPGSTGNSRRLTSAVLYGAITGSLDRFAACGQDRGQFFYRLVFAMKSRALRRIISLAVLAIGAVFLIYQGQGPARPGEDLSARELRLVSARCTKSESLDRWLLQQSWFHDSNFSQLAGAFGQTSFSFYPADGSRRRIEGAFCINGSDLMVRYYERRFFPVRLRWSELAVDLGTKLVPLGEDVYSVRELTRERMVLAFASDGREHVLYRKN